MGNLVEKCPPAAFVSTYPPRQCGIATFTCNLVKSLSTLSQHSKGLDNQNHLQVVALSKNPESYKFPADVHFLIRDQYQSDYRQAADFINLSAVDVVSLQHEYGIFGGPDGSHIITLLNNLKKPLVTTLHTVLMEPSANQKKTLEAIAKRSTYVVVLASKAMGILKEVYRVPEEKIVMIPHGTPDIAFLDSSFYKDQFQAEGKRIILTFGLLSPNKGIEYVIEAMARVVKRHPDTLFIILGVTHPEVRQLHGERYRISLENKVKELGLDQHVMFHNHFVSSEKLIQFLVAADIYVTPYLSREQIVSGTLAYAVSCGKAVISTPYWFAEELLNENRGILVPFRDSNAIAKKICDLLANEKKRNKLRKNAYQFGRQMRWSEVAKSYRKVFHKAMTRYRRETIVSGEQQTAPSSPTLPAIKLNHLYTLTDDTGILQHAIYSTPNREHGYCTDDNARALVVATAHYNLFHEEPILAPMQKYLAFLYHAFNTRKNRMRNFMSYDRRWLEDIGSEDCHGRTLYALGYAVSFAPNEHILGLANALFRHVVAGAAALSSPRTSAFSILGCLHYLQRFGGDTEGKTIASQLGQSLFELYRENSSAEWPWFEDTATYANAKLPQALLAVGEYLEHAEMIEAGLTSLKWLLRIQTDPVTGYLSPIGNSSWLRKGSEKAQFDQQPIEAAALIEACHQAYLITGENDWRQAMQIAFSWFLGKNDKGEYMYTFKTGGCFDGLQPTGPNLNQGAESTLSWLWSLLLMHQISHDETSPPPEATKTAARNINARNGRKEKEAITL